MKASLGMAASLALVLVACVPKLEGAHCLSDTNCPSQQTCEPLVVGSIEGVCKKRPTCTEVCSTKGLVCGLASGKPACQCPAAPFDGGFILSVTSDGMPASDPSHPTGSPNPANCSFRTLSDALDVANQIGASNAGFKAFVNAQTGTVYAVDERYPLTVGNGVTLSGNSTPTKVTAIGSLRTRQLVQLLPGGSIDSFVLASGIKDGEPMLIANCRDGGAASSVTNLIVTQNFDPMRGLDGGLLVVSDAGANTGLRGEGACDLHASNLLISTLGFGLVTEGKDGKFDFTDAGIVGHAGAVVASGGALTMTGVQLDSDGPGIVLVPRSAVSVSLTDGGISAPLGIWVQDGGQGVAANQVSVNVQNAVIHAPPSFLDAGLDFGAVVAQTGRTTLSGVSIPGGASFREAILGDGPETSLQLNDVQVKDFANNPGYGLHLTNGATATLQGGVFERNGVGIQADAQGGFEATGTAVLETLQQGIIVSGGTAKLHSVKVLNSVDGGLTGVLALSATGSAVTVDGDSQFQGYSQGAVFFNGSLVLNGTAAAMVQFTENTESLRATDTSVDATYVSFTGLQDGGSADVVAVNNSGIGVGPVSFRRCAFNSFPNGTGKGTSLLVEAAFPFDGGTSLEVSDSTFSGGERGIDFGNQSSSSGVVLHAAVTNTEISNFTREALTINAASAGTTSVVSELYLVGNRIHDCNLFARAPGAVVFSSGQPSRFLFQSNQVYKNRSAQLFFDGTTLGSWNLSGGATCATQNQISCYVKGQGVVATAPTQTLTLDMTHDAWLNTPPTPGNDYAISTSTTLNSSPACPVAPVSCL